jgi:hypothetical protein
MSIVLAMSTDDRVIVKSDGREMNNGRLLMKIYVSMTKLHIIAL